MTTLAPPITDYVRPELLDRWRELWGAQERPTPNTEPGRFLAVCDALGAEPAILEVDDGRGLIIARRERMRITRRIGYVPIRTPKLDSLVVVYGGFLGDAPADDFMERIENAMRDGVVEHVMINKLASDNPLFERLAARPRTVPEEARPHHVLELHGAFDEVMRRHSGKHRKKLRWERKKLEESYGDDFEFRTMSREEDIEEILKDAESISRKTYHASVGGLVERSDTWRAMLKAATEEGGLRAHFAVGRGEPVAFVIGWNVVGTHHVAAMAYLPDHAAYSPGKHTLLHAIERACEDGMTMVDYGFGDAEYKRIYGTRHWMESTVHLYGRGFRAGRSWITDAASMRADALCKRALGGPSAQKIKRTWRRAMSRGKGKAE